MSTCTTSILESVKANCQTIGGLDASIYIGRLPVTKDKAKDGSIFGLEFGLCGRLVKATSRKSVSSLNDAIADTGDSAVVNHSFSIPFYHGGDQRIIDRLNAYLGTENVFLIIEYQAGYFRAVGLDGGLRVTAGSDTSGTATTDPNNITLTFTGSAGEFARVLKRGSVEDTIAYLDGLTKFDASYVISKTQDYTQTADASVIVNANNVVAVELSDQIFISKNAGKTYEPGASISGFGGIDSVSEKVIYSVNNFGILKSENQGKSFSLLTALVNGASPSNESLLVKDDLIRVGVQSVAGVAIQEYTLDGQFVREILCASEGEYIDYSCGKYIAYKSKDKVVYIGESDLKAKLTVPASTSGRVLALNSERFLFMNQDAGGSQIYYTDNAGETWSTVLDNTDTLNDIASLDCQTIVAVGKNSSDEGIFYISTDGGKTWTIQESTLADTNVLRVTWINETLIAWSGQKTLVAPNNTNVSGQISIDCETITC